MQWPDGSQFEGVFKNGKPSGIGTMSGDGYTVVGYFTSFTNVSGPQCVK